MRGKAGVIEAAMAEYEEDGGLYLNSTVTEQRAYEVVRGRG